MPFLLSIEGLLIHSWAMVCDVAARSFPAKSMKSPIKVLNNPQSWNSWESLLRTLATTNQQAIVQIYTWPCCCVN